MEGSAADGFTKQRGGVIDYQTGDFAISVTREGAIAEHGLTAGEYWRRVDGREDPTDEERETHNLNPERAALMRDYMRFLRDLPMKLRDPGTRIDPVVEAATFDGRPVRDIKIAYDSEVGGDIWHIYVDPEDAHMIGYAFHHDEAETEGETIALEGEVVIGTARIPRTGAWTRFTDGEHLGTDTLLVGGILKR